MKKYDECKFQSIGASIPELAVHLYKLRKEHQMQKYSTIIGVIELRQSGIGYRTTKK